MKKRMTSRLRPRHRRRHLLSAVRGEIHHNIDSNRRRITRLLRQRLVVEREGMRLRWLT